MFAVMMLLCDISLQPNRFGEVGKTRISKAGRHVVPMPT